MHENDVNKKVEQLTEEINAIKSRNQQVESNKAWETSWTRKSIIAVFTYIVIAIFFVTVQLPNPYMNAIVPTAAFILSTASMPYLKKWWIKTIYKK